MKNENDSSVAARGYPPSALPKEVAGKVRSAPLPAEGPALVDDHEAHKAFTKLAILAAELMDLHDVHSLKLEIIGSKVCFDLKREKPVPAGNGVRLCGSHPHGEQQNQDL